jgi:CDP-diacylglycerol--serine O-phosphatidyltransferase
VLAFAWGVRSLTIAGTQQGELLSDMGWVCCLGFLVCCAWRLARFNVQGMTPGSSKYFVGLPTPPAAGVIAALVHGFNGRPLHDWRWSAAWFVLAAALGALMTSTIRYYSFKDIPWTRKLPSLTIVLAFILIAVIVKFSEFALVILACTYVAVGVALHLTRFIRHRMVSRTA